MNDLYSQLDRLESHLRSLIEGSTARLFPSYQTQFNLVNKLIEAIRESIDNDQGKNSPPPNAYTIHVHPSQAILIQSNPDLINELSELLLRAGNETGIVFLSQPSIHIVEDQDLEPGDVFVLAEHKLNEISKTSNVTINQSVSEKKHIPQNAFLIVDGTKVFQLDKAVINIGRRPDNHLVIDDTRVSRRHAQIRAINGLYVIFDLDSTGGTWINGKRIRKKTLQPGDVILLTDIPLVYGQETVIDGDTQQHALSSATDQDQKQNPTSDEQLEINE